MAIWHAWPHFPRQKDLIGRTMHRLLTVDWIANISQSEIGRCRWLIFGAAGNCFTAIWLF